MNPTAPVDVNLSPSLKDDSPSQPFARADLQSASGTPATTSRLSPGRWRLVVGPRSLNAALLTAVARMGLGGPVRVLDGGNRFNAYTVARAVGGRTDVLDRITVSRAFTCYQVLSLLESTPAIQVARAGIVVLDLLNTFYDESVRAVERRRLLRACLVHLERLAPGAGAISIHPPAIMSDTAVELLDILKASPVVETFFAQPALPPPEPWRLF